MSNETDDGWVDVPEDEWVDVVETPAVEVQAPPQGKISTFPAQTFAENLGNTATFGFGDEIGAALQSGLGKVANLAPAGSGDWLGVETRYPTDVDYTEARDDNRAAKAAGDKANPNAAIAGRVAGVVTGAALPLGAAAKVAQGVGAAGKAAAGALVGSTLSGAAAVGNDETDLTRVPSWKEAKDLYEKTTNASTVGSLVGAAGAVAPGLTGAGAMGVAAVGDKFGMSDGDRAELAVGGLLGVGGAAASKVAGGLKGAAARVEKPLVRRVEEQAAGAIQASAEIDHGASKAKWQQDRAKVLEGNKAKKAQADAQFEAEQGKYRSEVDAIGIKKTERRANDNFIKSEEAKAQAEWQKMKESTQSAENKAKMEKAMAEIKAKREKNNQARGEAAKGNAVKEYDTKHKDANRMLQDLIKEETAKRNAQSKRIKAHESEGAEVNRGVAEAEEGLAGLERSVHSARAQAYGAALTRTDQMRRLNGGNLREDLVPLESKVRESYNRNSIPEELDPDNIAQAFRAENEPKLKSALEAAKLRKEEFDTRPFDPNAPIQDTYNGPLDPKEVRQWALDLGLNPAEDFKFWKKEQAPLRAPRPEGPAPARDRFDVMEEMLAAQEAKLLAPKTSTPDDPMPRDHTPERPPLVRPAKPQKPRVALDEAPKSPERSPALSLKKRFDLEEKAEMFDGKKALTPEERSQIEKLAQGQIDKASDLGWVKNFMPGKLAEMVTTGKMQDPASAAKAVQKSRKLFGNIEDLAIPAQYTGVGSALQAPIDVDAFLKYLEEEDKKNGKL